MPGVCARAASRLPLGCLSAAGVLADPKYAAIVERLTRYASKAEAAAKSLPG